MHRTIATLTLTLGFILAGVGIAAADPITCPPGQVGTHNPSDGGWTCVNQGGNTNNSEDPRSPNADKGDFQH
jgi:hypothetical protein